MRNEGEDPSAALDERRDDRLGGAIGGKLNDVPVVADAPDAVGSRHQAPGSALGHAGHDQLPAPRTLRPNSESLPVATSRPSERMATRPADRFSVTQDVRAEEERATLVTQRQEQLTNVTTPKGIKPRHRLVKKHDLWVVDQGLGNTDALKHPLSSMCGDGASARPRCRPDPEENLRAGLLRDGRSHIARQSI